MSQYYRGKRTRNIYDPSEMLGILENAKLNIFYEQQQIGDEDVE